MLTVDNYLIMRQDTLHLEQGTFDLRGKDVDSADDQHVIRPSGNPLHTDERTPAGAGDGGQARDVPGPVPKDRKRLLGDRGENQLSDLPVGKRSAGDGKKVLV